MTGREYARRVARELASHGATRIRIDRSGRHPKARFEIGGRTRFWVMPGTPGDWRGLRNNLAGVRRMCARAACDAD